MASSSILSGYKVIDVSKYNTINDYYSVASNCNGVLIRIGYRGYGSSGTLCTDSSFQTHYNKFKSSKSSNFKIGIYWFTQAISDSEAIEEAEYVLYLLSKYNVSIDFPIFIDSEYSNTSHSGRADKISPEKRSQYIVTFINRIVAHGFRAGIYASESWYNNMILMNYIRKYSSTNNLYLWVAKYSSNLPDIGDDYAGWQYTSSYSMSGISGSVDMSYFYNIAGWSTPAPDPEPEKTINISKYVSTTAISDKTYTGSAIKPNVITNSSITEKVDYIIKYESNINVGTATITVKGINRYVGTVTKTFKIVAKSIDKCTVNFGNISYIYTGSAIVPNVTVYDSARKVYLTDFTVSCSNNINAGTASIKVTLNGNYTGNKSSYFSIAPVYFTKGTITLDKVDYKYTGSEIKPAVVSVKIVNPISGNIENLTNYTVKYNNNINVGKGTLSVEVTTGNIRGTLSTTFDIINKSLTTKSVTLSDVTYIYNGTNQVPTASVGGLIENTDYYITYPSSSVNVGVYTVRANGMGEWDDSCSATYEITKKSITSIGGYIKETEFYFSNREIKPEVYLNDNSLVENVDYKVSYSNNINVGKARVIVDGIGNYSNSFFMEFTIEPRDITTCIAKLGQATDKSIYRYTVDSPFYLYNNDEDYHNDIKVIEDKDYHIIDRANTPYDEFTLIIVEVEGINGYYGNMTYYFRELDEEPETPDREDDNSLEFGCEDDTEATAEGDYDFGCEDHGLDSSTVVPDNTDFDLEPKSGYYLANYDADNGTNITPIGIADYDDNAGPSLPDDGVFNFGCEDCDPATAEGDYDFGCEDHGVDPDTVAVKDYDFNVYSGDVDSGYEPGMEYILIDTPIYTNYYSPISCESKNGQYFIYSSKIKNNRIRITKLEDGANRPVRFTGWVNIVDLEKLTDYVPTEYVLVNGDITVRSNGTGGIIRKDDQLMYIKDIIADAEYPYALSSGKNSVIQGYGKEEMFTKIRGENY